MKISIVIPNYNGIALLKKNLPRLIDILDKDKAEAELILADDASKDGSCEWFTTFAENNENKKIQIRSIQNESNKGFSYTANRGANAASGEYIVFLNTDVYPKKGFLENSLKHFENPKMFAVGFMDESIEGEKIVLRGSGIGWWQKGFFVHKKGEVHTNFTDWVSGGSGIFRRELFKRLGGFDTIYDPFYWEDIDLSYRARKKGYKIAFEPKSIVVHEHQKGAILSKYSKNSIMQVSYRNQYIFVWNNASLWQLLVHIFWLPYHLAASLSGDKKLFFGFFLALFHFIHFKIFRK